jgi:hypothetical protein
VSIKEVVIGSRSGERVIIRGSGKANIEGWFRADIEIQCEGFYAEFEGEFMRGELADFAGEIQVLYECLLGKATLSPTEPYISLSLSGDSKGHVAVAGTARTRLGSETELTFCMGLDQTYLPAIVRSLREIDPT